MNKAEAIEYMQHGYTVTHEHFDSYEYMTINPENGKIKFEDNCECTIDEFFKIRNDESWENGYKVLDEFKSRQPSYLDFTNPYYMIENNMHLEEMRDYGLSKKQREANIVPVRSTPKIGRNELCPCGSGIKNKKCCKV